MERLRKEKKACKIMGEMLLMTMMMMMMLQ